MMRNRPNSWTPRAGATTPDHQRLLTLTEDDVERAIGQPVGAWSHQCHSVSLAIVKSDLFTRARVARGTARGVASQHSWVVVGDDCYARDAVILDCTAWSYDLAYPIVCVTTADAGTHRPHGAGSIWDWECPEVGSGPEVRLTPQQPLSDAARLWLWTCKDANNGRPLDRQFWAIMLASAPVGDWPAAELMAAADDTEEITALVPIDRLGMLTDRNPSGLYLKGDE